MIKVISWYTHAIRTAVNQNIGHTQIIGNVTRIFGSHYDCDHYFCDHDQYFGKSKILVTVTEIMVTVNKLLVTVKSKDSYFQNFEKGDYGHTRKSGNSDFCDCDQYFVTVTNNLGLSCKIMVTQEIWVTF